MSVTFSLSTYIQLSITAGHIYNFLIFHALNLIKRKLTPTRHSLRSSIEPPCENRKINRKWNSNTEQNYLPEADSIAIKKICEWEWVYTFIETLRWQCILKYVWLVSSLHWKTHQVWGDRRRQWSLPKDFKFCNGQKTTPIFLRRRIFETQRKTIV